MIAELKESTVSLHADLTHPGYNEFIGKGPGSVGHLFITKIPLKGSASQLNKLVLKDSPHI